MRFLNFTDEWYKSNFKNVLQMLKNNTLSRSELNYINGIVKNIHYGDVLIKFGSYIKSDSHLIPFINYENTPKKYKESLLKNGDIIIADTAEDETVGKATEIIMNDNSLILSGLHTIPCRPIQNKFASKYLGYYINSPSFHRQLLPLIQGIKVSSISKTQICETYISYPNQKEQSKITNFFTLIDQRLETQSKIIKELKSYKDIVCDKLLYSDKSIRYDKLSSFATLKNGYAFKSSAYETNGIFNIITIANVSGERYINTENCNKVNYLPTDIQRHQQLKNNDILISLTGNVGRVSMCNQNNCVLNQRVGLLEIKDGNLIEYIYQCLANKHFEKEMTSKGQGAAQLNIGKDDIENYKIPIYQKEKRNKICFLLKSLDKKIAIEEKILNDYHLMKKYLLSNMFI